MEQPPQPNMEIKNQKVFIEIGTDDVPVPRLGRKKFDSQNIYIGIEKNPKAVRISNRDFSDKSIYYVNADAERLPIGTEKVDEVFLGNILGTPDISENEKDKFMTEAIRILKKGGQIILKEASTPPIYPNQYLGRKDYLEDFAKRNNLAIKKVVYVDSPEWEDAIRDFDSSAASDKKSQAFVAFLEPLPQEDR